MFESARGRGEQMQEVEGTRLCATCLLQVEGSTRCLLFVLVVNSQELLLIFHMKLFQMSN